MLQQGQASFDTRDTDQTRLFVVLLALIFIYPLGVALMWLWMHTWARWIKVVLTTIPLLLVTLGVLGFVVAVAQNFSIARSERLAVQQQLEISQSPSASLSAQYKQYQPPMTTRFTPENRELTDEEHLEILKSNRPFYGRMVALFHQLFGR